MTMLVRGGATPAGSALPATATAGQVLQWNGSAWVAATPSASGTTPNATPTVPGLVQLAGDLGGTATAPTVPGLAGKANTASLAAVATSGSYGDLTGRPLLAVVATSGAYADLSGRPALAAVATSGAYTDLSGRPALAAVATSGAYTDLSGRPALAAVATSGAYADLTGTPTIPTVQTAYKTTDTTISNSTTKAADPHLRFAAVQVGTYALEIEGTLTCGSTAQAGVAWNIAGTATFTSAPGGQLNQGSSLVSTIVNATAGSSLISPSSSVAGTFRLSLPVTVTAAGSLAFTWAQSLASSSVTSTVAAGSWARLTKVA